MLNIYGQGRRPKSDYPSFPAKTKRLKRIFDNPAHVWANPRSKANPEGFEQTEAYNPTKNWYFRTSEDLTRVCYSYRDSYPIASRFESGKRIIFLLRSGKPYSVTTSAQMNSTFHAVPKNDSNVLVFHVPGDGLTSRYGNKPGQEEHKGNVLAYISDIQDAIDRFTHSRSSWNLKSAHGEAVSLTAETKQYAKLFHVKLPKLPAVPKLDEDKLDAIIAREKIREDKRDAKRKAERAEYERLHQEEVNAWLASDEACIHIVDGRPVHSYQDRHTCQEQTKREQWETNRESLILQWRQGANVSLRFNYSEPDILRVNQAEKTVETSQGVSVAIDGRAGAARLLNLLEHWYAIGKTFETNGHKEAIGNFQVSSFKPAVTPCPTDETKPEWVLTAGCHRILFSEVQSIADQVRTIAASEVQS